MMIGARNFSIWFLNKPTKGVQEKGRLIMWNTHNYLVHNFLAFTSNQKEYKMLQSITITAKLHMINECMW